MGFKVALTRSIKSHHLLTYAVSVLQSTHHGEAKRAQVSTDAQGRLPLKVFHYFFPFFSLLTRKLNIDLQQ